jgi:catalase (peroxidase I)
LKINVNRYIRMDKKEKYREISRKYYENNKEKIRAKARAKFKVVKLKEEKIKYIKSYYIKNKEKIREKANLKYRMRKEKKEEESMERKRIFLLFKKIDYIFGISNTYI